MTSVDITDAELQTLQMTTCHVGLHRLLPSLMNVAPDIILTVGLRVLYIVTTHLLYSRLISVILKLFILAFCLAPFSSGKKSPKKQNFDRKFD